MQQPTQNWFILKAADKYTLRQEFNEICAKLVFLSSEFWPPKIVVFLFIEVLSPLFGYILFAVAEFFIHFVFLSCLDLLLFSFRTQHKYPVCISSFLFLIFHKRVFHHVLILSAFLRTIPKKLLVAVLGFVGFFLICKKLLIGFAGFPDPFLVG